VKLVVDTNVFVSGIFFSGPPYQILDAWRHRRVELVVSQEILEEYRETGQALSADFPEVGLSPWIELVTIRATLVDAPPLGEQVCTDPDDDKFLACAMAGRVKYVTSGDKALLKASGYSRATVLTPRRFVDQHLK
jgi:putative PIN family toxin of toxin-antitoxin system